MVLLGIMLGLELDAESNGASLLSVVATTVLMVVTCGFNALAVLRRSDYALLGVVLVVFWLVFLLSVEPTPALLAFYGHTEFSLGSALRTTFHALALVVAFLALGGRKSRS